MEKLEYEIMFSLENEHWWYAGLRDLVLSTIALSSRGRDSPTILDAGCGTGKLLEMCGAYRAFGLEYSAEAFRFLRRRAVSNVTRATVCRMPFPDDSFHLVTCMDVICCVEAPGDLQALREIRRVLKPGGILLMNLPAYECLRSHHDAAVHTRQRYTRSRLRTMLRRAGLRDRMITYRLALPLLIAAVMRFVQKLLWPEPARPKSDLRPLPYVLNRALMLPLFMENRLIQAGVRLPFGLSVFCVATKS